MPKRGLSGEARLRKTPSLFLRKKRSQMAGETYEYRSLRESVRIARGPRPRVVACLGKLDEAEVRRGCWEGIKNSRPPPANIGTESLPS